MEECAQSIWRFLFIIGGIYRNTREVKASTSKFLFIRGEIYQNTQREYSEINTTLVSRLIIIYTKYQGEEEYATDVAIVLENK